MSKKHMTRNDLGAEVYVLTDRQIDKVKAHHAPIGYNAGVYGWNYDVYFVSGKTLVYGYRPLLKWVRLSDEDLMELLGL